MGKDLAIILLNYNGSQDTIECIQSIDASKTEYQYDVYILDNGSEKKNQVILEDYIKSRNDFNCSSFEKFKEDRLRGKFLIISDVNAGFAGGNNKIIHEIYKDYAYVLLLNNDTVVTTDFLEKMLDFLNADPETGYASCRIDNYYDRSLLWNCGGKLTPWGLRKYYSETELKKMPEVIPAEFITGCALFIRSSIIEKYGALTDDFFHGEEDFNFCWRMKKNHIKGACINKTFVYHKVSASSQKSGAQPGKMAGYYVCRIIDMHQFYPTIIWYAWKTALSVVLAMRWKRTGYTLSERRRMQDILKRASKLKAINKEDTLRIWNLEY